MLIDDPVVFMLDVDNTLLDYPFSERLYPLVLAALDHLRTIGTTAIVSDGNIVFQPRKIQRSGLLGSVDVPKLLVV